MASPRKRSTGQRTTGLWSLTRVSQGLSATHKRGRLLMIAGTTGQCLDLTNGRLSNGNTLQTWKCSTGSECFMNKNGSL